MLRKVLIFGVDASVGEFAYNYYLLCLVCCSSHLFINGGVGTSSLMIVDRSWIVLQQLDLLLTVKLCFEGLPYTDCQIEERGLHLFLDFFFPFLFGERLDCSRSLI